MKNITPTYLMPEDVKCSNILRSLWKRFFFLTYIVCFSVKLIVLTKLSQQCSPCHLKWSLSSVIQEVIWDLPCEPLRQPNSEEQKKSVKVSPESYFSEVWRSNSCMDIIRTTCLKASKNPIEFMYTFLSCSIFPWVLVSSFLESKQGLNYS